MIKVDKIITKTHTLGFNDNIYQEGNISFVVHTADASKIFPYSSMQ